MNKTEKSEYYNKDNCPIKCFKCESTDIENIIMSRDEAYVYEALLNCKSCEQELGYFAYGYYDPKYMENNPPVNSTALERD